jgi:hypothetical protein
MGKAHAVAIVTCTFAFSSLCVPVAAGEQLPCIDARPYGEMNKHIVFEKSGARSIDLFPLLKSWNSTTGIIDAINNGLETSIKVSDWTALNVEQVPLSPVAQVRTPTLVSSAPVDIIVNLDQIAISDGLIALSPHGCDGRSNDQSQPKVFFGKITFGPESWSIAGQYLTFSWPSWDAGPNRKPGG